MNDLLPARDAARALGVTYSTLKQWIYKGAVRTIRTEGGHHRVSLEEVERLLAAHEQQPRAASRPTPHGVLVALSSRNQLHGIVDEVRVDGLLAQVKLRIGRQTLTAVITRDAVKELKLRRGDEAVAIIKSTEVMVGREQAAPATKDPPARRRVRRSARRKSWSEGGSSRETHASDGGKATKDTKGGAKKRR